MNKGLFVVYTMTLDDFSSGKEPSSDDIVGIFTSFEKAKKIVESNQSNIQETVYDIAIIENLHEGLYPTVKKRYFYQAVDCPTGLVFEPLQQKDPYSILPFFHKGIILE